MIKYSDLNLVTAANPRSENGADKAVSSTRKKRVSADIILSVVAEKVKDEATGVAVPTGKLKTIFKMSKDCENTIDLQNVVGSIPKGYNAFVTRPQAQSDDSCVLFGSPKGKSLLKTRAFRATMLVNFLIATKQIPDTFGKSLEDVALLTVKEDTTIEGLPEGFKWFFVEKADEVVVETPAELVKTSIADSTDTANLVDTLSTPTVTDSVEAIPVVEDAKADDGDDEEVGEEDENGDEEVEEDPFA